MAQLLLCDTIDPNKATLRAAPRDKPLDARTEGGYECNIFDLGTLSSEAMRVSPPSETIAVTATPHIKEAPYTISERRTRRFCPICRPPKLQKETLNVLQNSQPLPAHPIPVARRHVGHIAGHHKRRDACDTRTIPQLRRYKTNKFHCQPSFPRDARQMRPKRERRLYFCGVETGRRRRTVRFGFEDEASQ